MALFDNVKTTEQAQVTEKNVGTAEQTGTKQKSEKAIAWEKARDKILAYIADENNKVPADILEAAKTFRPSFFGITSGGGGFAKKDHPAHVEKLFKLLGIEKFDDIKVGATFDEMKAFQTLKVGRKEMREMCNDLIKKPDTNGAVYVLFDANKGVYTVKGIGTEPEGWTGYRPAKAEADAE